MSNLCYGIVAEGGQEMITDSYDVNSEPIVKLESIYGEKKFLVNKCIIIFSKIIYEHMLNNFECEKISEVGACNGNIPVWSFEYEEERIVFYLTPIGSALAGGTIAEVHHLTGASTFIAFGSCGSLDREATDNKFIIPTQAYRGEGLSYYFAKPQDYIKMKNADKVAEIFSELHLPYVQGKVWTTDSMIRETVNLVNKRKQEGCIAVEMELAGIQAVCDFYGFEIYDFLAPGDVLLEDNYEIEQLAAANHNLDNLFIALQIAKRV